MNKFIILTTGRTGSTYLRLWVNNHPEIRCHDEVFNRGYGALEGFYKYVNRNYGIKALRKFFGDHTSQFKDNPVSRGLMSNFMDKLFYDEKASGPWTSKENWHDFHTKDMNPDIVGFKLIYSQFYYYQHFLQPWIIKNNIRIIHLIRHNVLEVYLSFLKARKTGVYHSESEHNITENKYTVDIEDAVSTMERMVEERKEIINLFPDNPVFEISYEDIFGSETREERMQSLFNFLGVKSDFLPETPGLKKVRASKLENAVANYDELCEGLKNTSFAAYINA